jgi:predicted Zn-dependent protease
VEEDAKERTLPGADCAAHPQECHFVGGKDLDIVSAKIPPRPDLESLYWRIKAANELAMQAFFRLGELPESLEIHQLRAEIARNSGRPREAVDEWRAALKLIPDDARARHELAVSLFVASDYRGALDSAVELLKHSPKDPELNFIAGDSSLRLEEPDKAEKYLRAALAADPKMTAAYASLGLALSRLGRNIEAVPLLEKSLELDDDGSLHYQLARAYQAAGNADKAKAAMVKYQELVDRNQKAKEEVAREAQIGPPK